MVENKYLLYCHYGISEDDTSSKIIVKAARKSYMDFCRRITFQNRVPMENRDIFEDRVKTLLSDMIPSLLESVRYENQSQELFDGKHNEICEAILDVYDSAGGQTYGIAQRWLNLTLMNLVLIDSIQRINNLPIAKTRKFFHVPVDNYLLEAATTKQNTYRHGLSLKYSPLKHDIGRDYQMDWYRAGAVQPFEKWEYQEYIEFQNAIRDKLREFNYTLNYSDSLDWAFKAFLEVSQARNR